MPAGQKRWQQMWRAGWNQVHRAGQLALHWQKSLDSLTVLFGLGLGLYTGILLNTIPARPLWNSSILPFLFLASGLASGCAFLGLFIAKAQIKQLGNPKILSNQ
jgi:formate-dependent nitrite reductase membrane component NrfD